MGACVTAPATRAQVGERFARLLWAPGDVREVRIPGYDSYGSTASGYFDSPQALAEAAARWDGKANVYVTLNPVNPALLARRVNRIDSKVKRDTTADVDVFSRRWIFFDIDPVRPTAISSTDVEKAAAMEVARNLTNHLRDCGWPEPVTASSGNGYYVLYPIHLPNTAEALSLVSGVLKTLALRFDTAEAHVDTVVSNASRIIGLVGTMKVKGDSTADRPHRRSELVSVPEALICVTEEQLRAILPVAPPTRAEPNRPTYSSGPLPQAEDMLSSVGADYRMQPTDVAGIVWFNLRDCPFCGAESGRYKCGIGQTAGDGAYTAKCFCYPERHWQDFKAALGLDRFFNTTRAHVAASSAVPRVSIDAFEDFWQSRLELHHLRAYALAHRVSPWALLGCVLARVVAATPPGIVLPAVIGDVASINIFIALVGSSGSGKGAAEASAARFIDFGAFTPFAEHRPGSGQGLAHAYGHVEKKKGEPARMVRHASAALFSLQEADTLRGLVGQQGSTLMPELRSLAMGERLGHLFVDPEKRVEIPAHTYRASMIVGVQPVRAGVILDDAAGGTPQRFIWLPTAYPHPEVRPDEVAGLGWELPATEVDRDENGMYQIPLCSTAIAQIDAAHLARARGDGDALDGHLLLTQEKVAAALGLFNRHVRIDDADWQLAQTVMDVSAQTRADVVAALAEARELEVQQRALRHVITARAVDEDLAARAFAAAQRQAVNHVIKNACGGCSRRCITQAIASKYRAGVSVDEVITDAINRDYLTVSENVTYVAGKRKP